MWSKRKNNINLLFFLFRKVAVIKFLCYLCKQINRRYGKTNIRFIRQADFEVDFQDARIPFLEVARACNVSGAAIHQRVAKLSNLGIIKGSQFIIDPEKIGYETCAYMGLYLKEPEKFDQVVEELKRFLRW